MARNTTWSTFRSYSEHQLAHVGGTAVMPGHDESLPCAVQRHRITGTVLDVPPGRWSPRRHRPGGGRREGTAREVVAAKALRASLR